MLAAGIAALAALPFAQPLRVAVTDFPALLALGVLQTGMGCLLLALAMPKLTAAELSLIGVAEPVLAPLWVWLLLNERPGNAALIGSALVISAVIANQILTLRTRPTA
jgi:drug/metabolite transporter (DMT)-like permease